MSLGADWPLNIHVAVLMTLQIVKLKMLLHLSLDFQLTTDEQYILCLAHCLLSAVIGSNYPTPGHKHVDRNKFPGFQG